MADPFSSTATGRESPGMRHFTITPNNSVDIPIRPRAIRAGGDGNIAIRDEVGTDITYAVVAGDILPFSPVRILATGTTATPIVGWV